MFPYEDTRGGISKTTSRISNAPSLWKVYCFALGLPQEPECTKWYRKGNLKVYQNITLHMLNARPSLSSPLFDILHPTVDLAESFHCTTFP